MPWRKREAEIEILGKPAVATTFMRAASIALEGAKGYGDNAFKIELARRTIVRALTQAAKATPQLQSSKKII